MKNVVINADDFGLRSSVNRAIVELLDSGSIQTTTLMANMPGFDEAVALAQEKKLADKVGIHLVLTDGIPLTEKMRAANFLFHGKARFKEELKKNLFYLSREKQELIYNELAAQIERLRASHLEINHVDSHHHVHEWYSVTKIIFALMKKYQIRSVRILNNMEQNKPLSKRMYRQGINYIMKRRGFNFSDLFGSYSDYRAMLANNRAALEKKKIEVMVHPDYDALGQVVDKIDSSKSNPFAAQMLELNYSDNRK